MPSPVVTTEFTQEILRYALKNGATMDHPMLAGRFARRVAAMIVDGKIQGQRVRGRWYVDPALAPRAAEIMGLLPAEEDKALYQTKTKNPPAASND
jgi:hypothetical protein